MGDYIAKVQSNLKSGADYELGQHTLIVGPNGSGKSSVIGAIEFALTGRVSDVAGKQSIATPPELITLAPGRQGELWAHLVLSTSEEVSMRMQGRIGTASKPVPKHPACVDTETAHPVRMLIDGLSSVQKAQRFLLESIGASVSHDEIIGMFIDHLQEPYRTMTKGRPDPVGTLIWATNTAAERARDAQKIARKAETQEEMTFVLSPPSEEEIYAVQGRISALEAELRQARAAAQAKRAKQDARERLPRLEAELAKAEERLSQEQRQTLEALKHLLNLCIRRELTSCGLCAQKVPAGHWDERAAKLAPKMAKLEGTGHTRALGIIIQQIEHNKRIIEEEILEVRVEKEICEDLDVQFQELQRLGGLRERWNQQQGARQDGVAKAKEAEIYDALNKEAIRVGRALLDRAAAVFSGLVTDRLPEGDQFLLRLAEGKRKVVQYGLVRDGILHTALSGAEWARVTCALADVVVRGQPGLHVIMPEERAFDPKTLGEVMRALGKSEFQVILTSPVKYKGRKPAGWTVIELDEGSVSVEPPDAEPSDGGSGNDEYEDLGEL